jgi:hypothetical protein
MCPPFCEGKRSTLRLCCAPDGSLTSCWVSSRLPSGSFSLPKAHLVPFSVLVYLLRFSGRGLSFVPVLSLRPKAALNHPHLSCITPAIELWGCQRNAPATRAVCYHFWYGERYVGS